MTTPTGPQAQEAGEHYEYEFDRAYDCLGDGKPHVAVSYWRNVKDVGFLKHTTFCEVTHGDDARLLAAILNSKRESSPPHVADALDGELIAEIADNFLGYYDMLPTRAGDIETSRKRMRMAIEEAISARAEAGVSDG